MKPPIYFISYSRIDQDDIREICRTLMIHGIKPWQDIRSLGTGLTEDQIKKAIREECTGLLFYSTEASVTAPMIRDVELPEAEKKHKLNNAFHIVPIFKLPIDKTVEALKDCLSIPINNFNGAVMKDAGLLGSAQRAAEIILKEIQLDKQAPFPLGLVSKQKTSSLVGLDLDFNLYFDSGVPRNDLWNTDFRSAILCLKNALIEKNIKHLRLFSSAHLTFGYLFGYIFRDRTGFQLDIMQKEEIWSTKESGELNPLKMTCSPGDLGSKNLVIKLNLMSDDTASIVSCLSSHEISYRVMLDVSPPGYPFVLSARQAISIAKDLTDKIKQLHAENKTNEVHMFSAVPLGLAFFIGYFSNACGKIHCYEFINSSREYIPSAILEDF